MKSSLFMRYIVYFASITTGLLILLAIVLLLTNQSNIFPILIGYFVGSLFFVVGMSFVYSNLCVRIKHSIKIPSLDQLDKKLQIILFHKRLVIKNIDNNKICFTSGKIYNWLNGGDIIIEIENNDTLVIDAPIYISNYLKSKI